MKIHFVSELLLAATTISLPFALGHEGHSHAGMVHDYNHHGHNHGGYHQHHHSMKHHEHHQQTDEKMEHEAQFERRPHTHVMYHHVEQVCAKDVAMFCPDEQVDGRNLPATLGDPFLDWFFSPTMQSPPAELLELSRIMDTIFDSSFIEPSRQHVTLYIVEEPRQAPQFIADSVAAKVVEQHDPEDVPKVVSDLKKYGTEAMKKFEESTFEHHVARRLSEVDATTIQHNIHLPFGCKKNRCLQDAISAGKVSEDCRNSIERMVDTYSLESMLEEREAAYIGMMYIYFATMCIMLIILARKLKNEEARTRIKNRILQAVYSNRAVKDQVEADLGESIGFVPPLPKFNLKMMGVQAAETRRRLADHRAKAKIYVLFLLLLLIVAPCLVLPFCVGMAVFRVLRLCFSGVVEEEAECECCCCGVSTTDVKNGLVTEEQACCCCCQGLGVCKPACASCCGSGDEISGDCDDCCCGPCEEDEPKGKGSKHVVAPRKQVYEGVSVEVV